MSSEIEDFELSLALNTAEAMSKTADSAPSTQKSRKTSPVHEHCRTPTLEERQEKPGSQWIWCKYCPKFPAQSTTNMRQCHGLSQQWTGDASIEEQEPDQLVVLYTRI